MTLLSVNIMIGLPQTNILKVRLYLLWAFPMESDAWGTQDNTSFANNLFLNYRAGRFAIFLQPLHTQGGKETKEDYSFTLWSNYSLKGWRTEHNKNCLHLTRE